METTGIPLTGGLSWWISALSSLWLSAWIGFLRHIHLALSGGWTVSTKNRRGTKDDVWSFVVVDFSICVC